MITLLAIVPRVSSCSIGTASAIELAVCVAPNSIAFSRLNSTGSTAMTRFAPAKVGTFSEVACVAEASVIKVDPDLPLESVALVSCGVATGWGSATNRADVQPGDTVVVVGIGGIGINAVQGAKMAGAKRVIAVDPVEFKR